MFRSFACIAAAIAINGPAAAQVDLEQAQSCFEAALAAQANPSQCIDVAQASCMDNAAETPAVATLCFATAQDDWSEALGPLIAQSLAEAEEPTASILRIETKYDLLANLMQCDRVEELAIAASDLSSEAIALQTARCQSTASAVTYMRLYLRAQSLPDGDPL